jgi:hypothetical protein
VLLLGDRLGHIGFVQRNKGYIDYAVVVVVALSLVPAAIHYLQGRRHGGSRHSGLRRSGSRRSGLRRNDADRVRD